MNFLRSLPNQTQRALALTLSAGFLLFLPGCGLRSGTTPEPPTVIRTEHSDPAALLTAAFGSDNPHLSRLTADDGTTALPKPDFSHVLALPERKINEGAEEWIARYGEKSGELLLTEEEISAYNERIIQNCPTVTDIANPPKTMDGKTVQDMIYRYSMPAGDRYTQSGAYITASDRQIIEKRRDHVPHSVNVRLGVITNRCSLTSVPSSFGFYKYGDTYYSDIQETELITGFPVWILHESSDGAFYFVQSYYYTGWIASDCAAVCSREEFDRFAEVRANLYVTVTDARLDRNGVRLDMGTVLPYLSEDENDFLVSLPARGENGTLILRTERLPKESCILGSLPYTPENTIHQAFAFLGTPYGWGGAGGNVDCSGFICAVYRCFGMYLPRNTGEQLLYNGESVNLSGLTADQKHAALTGLGMPSTVHWTGHVMLYLGEKNGVHYVIHAPQGGETVTVMPLNMHSTYLRANRMK